GIHAKRPWDEESGNDASGNLIFQSLAALLQMAPNSKHCNGHSIVRASIPAGTLLYHGSLTREHASRDWIAFDLEHAFIFARGSNGTLFTLMATRELNFIYFDGCSANKLGAVVGRTRGHWEVDDLARFNDGCDWAKPHGIDGFIRMEWEFEIMHCNLSQGLESGVPDLPQPTSNSTADPLNGQLTPQASFHGLRPGREDLLVRAADDATALVDLPPLIPPKGWKGTLPFTLFESRHTGTWHNNFPGELRVQIYPSTLISFFDPALTSLVTARRSQKREEYRAGNASAADIARVRADIAEMMSRDWSPEVRGNVDWIALARVVQDRYADRLPYMQYLLHSPAANVSEHMVLLRKQLVVSLIPYMPREHIGSPDWFANIAYNCAESFAGWLPMERFTKQERVLLSAVEEVLHEICRVYTEAWVDAFDVESKSDDVARELMRKWRGEFDKLVEWLDWPGWIKCEPECGPDEYCLIPQARWWSWYGTDPTCVSVEDETYEPQAA
ncbi:uncharacterized protein B0H18DRAFT_1004463, partial [Fomitopsis serialis]|uniref:uncharacterized protein n=1 Tax=Fomitopsis serialis TaxID=139415 RepID=UPI0020089AD2